jgi:hypothetical protein
MFTHDTATYNIATYYESSATKQLEADISMNSESIPTASANYLTIFTRVILLTQDHQVLVIMSSHAPNFRSVAVCRTKHVVPKWAVL